MFTALRRTLALFVLPTAVIAVALTGTASATAAQSQPVVTPAVTTQGIIMRDGGICDPIRHMGC